jgi:hypothetical protein
VASYPDRVPSSEETLPLTDEDIAILALESDTVAGHTCKVIRVDPPGIGFEDLAVKLAERARRVPELNRRLDPDPDAPAWVPVPDLRLDRHLVQYARGKPVAESELAGVTAHLFGQRLDREYPLWRIEVVQLEDGGTALIWRIHHVLADGTTAMRLAREILWDEDGPPAPVHEVRSAPARSVSEDDDRRRRHILGLFGREFSRDPGRSPFDGSIGQQRAIAFATVSLSGLHDSARAAAGATLNDAVLDVVAGALRHWLELHHVDEPDRLTVKVPVSLHDGNDTAGNLDSFFAVPLPLGEPDTGTRLAAIAEATRERKQDHDAQELYGLMRRVSHTSKRLGHLLARIEASPRRFALNVSNVKGPREDVSVLGKPVTGVHSIVEIGEHHALRVAVVSVGDRLCFGFCADPHLIEDLDRLAEGAEDEAGRIIALTGAP